MPRFVAICLALLLASGGQSWSADTARVPLADGFEIPVGRNGKSYYKARGVRPNGHLGEDWNGTGGGDTDLGDPIYSSADGIVVFARDYRVGWGNVVIVRTAYLEKGEVRFVDSLYGHLLDFKVQDGEIVKRGQQIGRMGSNRGMYPAHLHFEMRKNINVGMYRNSFARDWSVYWSPTEFILDRVRLPGGGRIVQVPINTFSATPPPLVAATKVYTPALPVSRAGVTVQDGRYVSNGRSLPIRPSTNSTSKTKPGTTTTEVRRTPVRRPEFRVNRFEDMRILGYE